MDPEPRWWRPGLFVVIGVAIAVRVVFALVIAPHLPPPGDSTVYRTMARTLADGDGMRLEPPGTTELELSAEHPPVFPGFLASLDLVGLDGYREQGVALGVVSGAGVGLVALLGRRFGGPAVGLVAAGIAALHPMWFQSAGVVMSESVHLVLVPAVLLVGLRARERPSPRRLVALGGLIGLAALNRPESLGFVVVVALPAIVLARPGRAVALKHLAAVTAVVLLVIAPWLVRNQVQLDAVTMATNSGKTLLGSNCDGAFAGPGLGGFDTECFFGAATYLVEIGPPGGGDWDPVAFDAEMGESGRRFLDEHRGEVPKVVLARVARMWGLAFAEDQLTFDVGEGRHRPSQRAGQWLHLGLVPLALAGGVLATRRGHGGDAVIVAGIPVLVTLTCLLVYGGTRMRSGAEPSIAVFAAFALVAVATAMARSRDEPDLSGSLSSR